VGGWEKFQKQKTKNKKKGGGGGLHNISFGIWKGIA